MQYPLHCKKMIPESTIQTVKEQADILSVIGAFVDLKKHGKDYRGKSPFNEEKTPSFYVVLSKGKPFFKDFSSGKSGDVITFLQEHLGLTYIQAIQYLAERQGILIEHGSDEIPKPTTPVVKKEQPPKEIQFIPEAWLTRSLHAQQYANNFLQFFANKFGPDKAEQVRTRFKIGYSNWRKGANVFWYIDQLGRVTQGKIMLYNPETGKRDKHTFNTVHSLLSKAGHISTDYTLSRSLFGLHQLAEQENIKCIGLVESEKTACICSIFIPSVLWMATGGKEFFKAELLEPLKQYPIVAYPDLDAWDDWKAKSEQFITEGLRIAVSDLLHRCQAESEKDDLADFLLRIAQQPKEQAPEYALDGTLIHPVKGYPVSWDIVMLTPLERMIAKNPHLKDLIKTFDLVE